MTDQAREFRRTAAECLALAQTTTDPNTRAPPPIDFDAIVQGFNDQQMAASGSKPVMQQQQQAQPKTEDKD